MNENNVFLMAENSPPELSRDSRSNGNNCHGHKTAINAGGNGHYNGDGCNCDSFTVSIDGVGIPLIITAFVIIILAKIFKKSTL